MLNRNGEWILADREMEVFYKALKQSDPMNSMLSFYEEQVEAKEKEEAFKEEFSKIPIEALKELLSKKSFQKGERYTVAGKIYETILRADAPYGNCRGCSLTLLCEVNIYFCSGIQCNSKVRICFKEVTE